MLHKGEKTETKNIVHGFKTKFHFKNEKVKGATSSMNKASNNGG